MRKKEMLITIEQLRNAVMKQGRDIVGMMLEVDNVKEERDQAVEDIRALGRMGANICPLCAHYNHGEGGKQCIACPKMDNFAWRGLVKGVIDDAPTIDVVSIVRCRECKYRHCSEYCECRPEDAYCSDGEKIDWMVEA